MTSAGTPSTETVYLDAADRLAQNLDCAACAYNLRGLSLEGACPECGRAVRESLPGLGFLRADPRWLKHLATGLGVLMGALIAAPILFIFVWPLVVIGGWTFTSDLNGQAPQGTQDTHRQQARWTLLGSTGLIVGGFLSIFVIGSFGIMWCSWWVGIVATWLMMYRYAAAIARRFAQPSLMKNARRLTLASGIALGGVLLTSLVFTLEAFNRGFGTLLPEALLILNGFALAGFMLASLVILIMTIALIETFRKQMSEAGRRLGEKSRSPEVPESGMKKTMEPATLS